MIDVITPGAAAPVPEGAESGFYVWNKKGEAIPFYIPTPKQRLFHERTEPNVLFWGGRGSGKLIRLSTPIPTPIGMVTMGTLCVGDQVLDDTGKPCNVVWKSEPHIDPTGSYKITFDDGTEVIAGGQHEWLTMTSYERRKAKKRSAEYKAARKLTRKDVAGSPVTDGRGRYPRKHELAPPTGMVRTTKEVAETLREYRFTGYGLGESNHSIPVCGTWQFPNSDLLVDPYVLGAWLGDGSKSSGQMAGLDEGIFEEIQKLGWEVRRSPTCPKCWHVYGLITSLKKLGVAGNKHIPTPYLFASADQRLSLLQGLMDTDGYCSPETGTVEFCNTNKNLADGVFILASSLGLKPNFAESRATLYGKDCGPKYRVCWTGKVPVFRLQRKLAHLNTTLRSTTSLRYITNVERIPDELMQCIEVDSPSHLYLITNAGIPTHNSKAGRCEAHARALATPNFAYCILRRTHPELLKSHLKFIDAEMKQLGGYFHHTDKIAHYPNGSTGTFSHCQNEKDVLNLLSAEFQWMFFDELSTFEWEMFTKLSASCRVTEGSNLIAMVRAATNPLGPSAEEVRRYFVDHDITPEEDPDYVASEWYSVHANLEDNKHVDQVQYVKRFSGMQAHVRKAWLDGEFVIENSLFEFWPTQRHLDPVTGTVTVVPYHVIPYGGLDMAALLRSAQIYRAYDNGWFPDPSVCLWIAHLGARYIVFHEEQWHKTLAVDIAADIKRITKSLGIERVVATFCDPSIDLNTTADIRTIKDVFEMNGVPMECSVNNRELYASSVHTALGTEVEPGLPKLQVYGPGCPNLVKTIPQQRYDIKRPLAMANHHSDHWVVTTAYFLISAASDSRQSITPTIIRPWMKGRSAAPDVLGRESVKH